ncbi:MAG: DUF5689 domain-containing protein [Christiangramia sp.]|uniref:DUF5689 domain-containing protein n=1 Tax=Christiangramia sp. TaxID=1931228 RepID=UPI003241EE54
MKNFLALSLLLLLNSCVTTDDYDLPDLTIIEPEFTGNLTSIKAVKGNFDLSTGDVYTFRDTNTWFEAYVVSSDLAGNFYKKLVLQDRPENPTAGIQILLDDNSLASTFDFGRKLYIKLDGLSMAFSNGVLQLGLQNRGDVVAIPSSMIDDFVMRSDKISEIVPLSLRIADFSSDLNNLYIRLNNVQFDRTLVRENDVYSFASNIADQYDGARELESCETGETTILSTSTYADFRSLLLPSGSGSVEGVLTRDFYDEHFVIVLNSPEKLQFNGERCDPEFANCSDNPEMGSQVIFEENFDGVTSNTTLNSRHWTNVNSSGGEKKWTPTLSNGNRVLRITAYNTNESPLEAWLVSPELDLSGWNKATLSFDLLAGYDNGMFLKVFVTRNFSGDPRTTNWEPLDANIPLGPSGAYLPNFRKSMIDVSCLGDKIWIGFQYLGAAPDKTTTYDLDNFRLSGN